jgi:Type VI secretion system (T6SS), amidase effector protein 4
MLYANVPRDQYGVCYQGRLKIGRAEFRPPPPNHKATIARASNREFYYLASVDEMKGFLDRTFEPARKISSRTDIEDQPGIVVFMGTPQGGVHTEIWTGDNFHQTFMKNNFASLKMPNVWFWSLGDPTLVDIRARIGRRPAYTSRGDHPKRRFGRRTQAVTLVTALRGLICSNET